MYKHVAIDNDTHNKLKQMAKRNGRSIVGQMRFLVDYWEQNQWQGQDAVRPSGADQLVASRPKTDTDIRLAELGAKLDALERKIADGEAEEDDNYFNLFNEVVALQKKQQEERGLTPML